MKLDLSQIKKIKETPHEAVFQHEQGHKIILSKSGLDKNQRKTLSSLPMHFAGDEDHPEDSEVPVLNIDNEDHYDPKEQEYKLLSDPDVSPQIKQKIADKEGISTKNALGEEMPISDLVPQTGGRVPVEGLPEVPVAEEKPAVQQPGSTPAVSSPNFVGQYQGAAKGYEQGIQNQAAAEGNLGKEQAQILDPAVKQQQEALGAYNERVNKYSDQYDKFIQDYQNQHIDSKHYLNSMGAGQKLTTAIGLILGGLGGGSAPIDFLNRQIANDIDAQKAEMGKSENLLTANYRQFGNMNEASKMTQAMQQGIVSNQLAVAAAKASDPIAKARALQASKLFEMQSMQTMRQLSLQQTMLNQLNKPSGGNEVASSGNIASNLIARKNAGLIDDKTYQQAVKELNDMGERIKARDLALSTFDKLGNINTIGQRITSPYQTSEKVQALRDNAATMLAREEAGRVNEYEFKAAQKAMPGPGNDQTTIKDKRNNLLGIANAKIHAPVLEGLGFDINGLGTYDRSGNLKIKEGAPKL